MQKALRNLPVEERPVPEGVVQANGDYYYAENSPGNNLPPLDFEEGATSEMDKQ